MNIQNRLALLQNALSIAITAIKPTKAYTQAYFAEGRDDEGNNTVYYIPSLPKRCHKKMSKVGIIRAYGVIFPTEFCDIALNQFAEKIVIDKNNEMLTYLVPKWKSRRAGESLQDFYQRVGLQLPPIKY